LALNAGNKAAKGRPGPHGKTRNEAVIRRNLKPLMIAVGGMSGSGKTTLASALVEKLPGSVLLDSDVMRKKMEGVSPETPLPAEAYTPEKTRKFIKYIQREASTLLKQGHSVVVTGTFLGNEERKNQQLVAQKVHADFIGIYLDAPLSVLFDRVSKRTDSASDADSEVVRRQVRKSITGQQGLHWHIVNAAQPQADVQRDAVRLVARELHRYRVLNLQSAKPPSF
jgi:predicted kinase